MVPFVSLQSDSTPTWVRFERHVDENNSLFFKRPCTDDELLCSILKVLPVGFFVLLETTEVDEQRFAVESA